MARVICHVKDCKHYDGEGGCELDYVTLDDGYTAIGLIPNCMDYEDKEDGDACACDNSQV